VALRAGVDPLTLTTLRVTGTVVVLAIGAALFHRQALRPPPRRLALDLVARHEARAALGARLGREPGVRRRQRRAAGVAESRLRPVLVAARRARRHVRSVGRRRAGF
jgi:hypothetical protein